MTPAEDAREERRLKEAKKRAEVQSAPQPKECPEPRLTVVLHQGVPWPLFGSGI